MSFFLLISFTLLNIFDPSFSYAGTLGAINFTDHEIQQVDPRAVMDTLKIPEDIGIIREAFFPEENAQTKLIFYLQSAHTNFDSESNTRRIIELFETEYHLPFVFLEGGEGRLDSLFFKSFPDTELKEKVLRDYLKRGDLSGGEVASILDEVNGTQFYGIENQALYQENKAAFLAAIEKEEEILKQLDEIDSRMQRSAAESFTEDVKTFYEQGKAFRRGEIDLIEYLKTLRSLFEKSEKKSLTPLHSVSLGVTGKIQSGTFRTFQASYPELQKLLKAESAEKQLKTSEVDIAASGVINEFKEKILPKLPKSQQVEMNQLIQRYRIGHLSQGLLTQRVKSLAQEQNFFFEVPRALALAARQARTLASIKGTKLFEELRVLERDLRASLPQSDEERSLLEDFQNLELLRSFAKLELERDDWNTLRDKRPSDIHSAFSVTAMRNTRSSSRGGVPRVAEAISDRQIASSLLGSLPRNDGVLDSLFASHYEFYRLAEQRDAVLLDNALKRMQEEKSNLALIATGGFHTEGITKKLKEKKIPYVLIAPKINELGDRENYLNVMRGKRSFMAYFSGSLWDALAQDYTAKLAESLNEYELTPSLKKWRDRIIQNAIAEGRVTQAGRYTKYVDALVQALRKEYEKDTRFGGDRRADFNLPYDRENELRKRLESELNSFYSTYFDKLEALLKQHLQTFGDGLKEMWKTGDITPASVSRLIDGMHQAPRSTIAADLALIHRTTERGELRTAADVVDDVVAAIVDQINGGEFEAGDLEAAQAQLQVVGLNPITSFLVTRGIRDDAQARQILNQVQEKMGDGEVRSAGEVATSEADSFAQTALRRAQARIRRETVPREEPEEVPMPETVPAEPEPAPAPAGPEEEPAPLPEEEPAPRELEPVPVEPDKELVPASLTRSETRAVQIDYKSTSRAEVRIGEEDAITRVKEILQDFPRPETIRPLLKPEDKVLLVGDRMQGTPTVVRSEARNDDREDVDPLRRDLKRIFELTGVDQDVNLLTDEQIRKQAKETAADFMNGLRIRLKIEPDSPLMLPLALVVAASTDTESELLVNTARGEVPQGWTWNEKEEVLLPLSVIAQFLELSPFQRASNFLSAYQPLYNYYKTLEGEIPKGENQSQAYVKDALALVELGFLADFNQVRGMNGYWELYVYPRTVMMPQTLPAFLRLLKRARDAEAKEMAEALLEGLRKIHIERIQDERANLYEEVSDTALAMLTLYLRSSQDEASPDLPTLRLNIQEQIRHLSVWEDQQKHLKSLVTDPDISPVGTTLFVPDLTDQQGNKVLKLGVISDRTFHDDKVSLKVIWAYYSKDKGEVILIDKESLDEVQLAEVFRVRYLQYPDLVSESETDTVRSEVRMASLGGSRKPEGKPLSDQEKQSYRQRMSEFLDLQNNNALVDHVRTKRKGFYLGFMQTNHIPNPEDVYDDFIPFVFDKLLDGGRGMRRVDRMRHSYKPSNTRETPEAYLNSVIHHLWLDFLRSRSSQDRKFRQLASKEISMEQFPDEGDTVTEVLRRERRGEIWKIYFQVMSYVNTLPKNERDIFYTFYILGETDSAMSKRMNIAIGTIKSTLFRVRQQIRNSFHRDFEQIAALLGRRPELRTDQTEVPRQLDAETDKFFVPTSVIRDLSVFGLRISNGQVYVFKADSDGDLSILQKADAEDRNARIIQTWYYARSDSTDEDDSIVIHDIAQAEKNQEEILDIKKTLQRADEQGRGDDHTVSWVMRAPLGDFTVEVTLEDLKERLGELEGHLFRVTHDVFGDDEGYWVHRIAKSRFYGPFEVLQRSRGRAEVRGAITQEELVRLLVVFQEMTQEEIQSTGESYHFEKDGVHYEFRQMPDGGLRLSISPSPDVFETLNINSSGGLSHPSSEFKGTDDQLKEFFEAFMALMEVKGLGRAEGRSQQKPRFRVTVRQLLMFTTAVGIAMVLTTWMGRAYVSRKISEFNTKPQEWKHTIEQLERNQILSQFAVDEITSILKDGSAADSPEEVEERVDAIRALGGLRTIPKKGKYGLLVDVFKNRNEDHVVRIWAIWTMDSLFPADGAFDDLDRRAIRALIEVANVGPADRLGEQVRHQAILTLERLPGETLPEVRDALQDPSLRPEIRDGTASVSSALRMRDSRLMIAQRHEEALQRRANLLDIRLIGLSGKILFNGSRHSLYVGPVGLSGKNFRDSFHIGLVRLSGKDFLDSLHIGLVGLSGKDLFEQLKISFINFGPQNHFDFFTQSAQPFSKGTELASQVFQHYGELALAIILRIIWEFRHGITLFLGNGWTLSQTREPVNKNLSILINVLRIIQYETAARAISTDRAKVRAEKNVGSKMRSSLEVLFHAIFPISLTLYLLSGFMPGLFIIVGQALSIVFIGVYGQWWIIKALRHSIGVGLKQGEKPDVAVDLERTGGEMLDENPYLTPWEDARRGRAEVRDGENEKMVWLNELSRVRERAVRDVQKNRNLVGVIQLIDVLTRKVQKIENFSGEDPRTQALLEDWRPKLFQDEIFMTLVTRKERFLKGLIGSAPRTAPGPTDRQARGEVRSANDEAGILFERLQNAVAGTTLRGAHRLVKKLLRETRIWMVPITLPDFEAGTDEAEKQIAQLLLEVLALHREWYGEAVAAGTLRDRNLDSINNIARAFEDFRQFLRKQYPGAPPTTTVDTVRRLKGFLDLFEIERRVFLPKSVGRIKAGYTLRIFFIHGRPLEEYESRHVYLNSLPPNYRVKFVHLNAGAGLVTVTFERRKRIRGELRLADVFVKRSIGRKRFEELADRLEGQRQNARPVEQVIAEIAHPILGEFDEFRAQVSREGTRDVLTLADRAGLIQATTVTDILREVSVRHDLPFESVYSESPELQQAVKAVVALLNERAGIPARETELISKASADLGRALFDAIVGMNQSTVFFHTVSDEEYDRMENPQAVFEKWAEAAGAAVAANANIAIALTLPRQALGYVNREVNESSPFIAVQRGNTVWFFHKANAHYLDQMFSPPTMTVALSRAQVEGPVLLTDRHADRSPISYNGIENETALAELLITALGAVSLAERTKEFLDQHDEQSWRLKSEADRRALAFVVLHMLTTYARAQALKAQAA